MVALEWQMAINWVRSTDIEPAKKQALNKIDDLLEFAQSLRDGYILCLVANSLRPGTIKDISKINNVNMHEFLCNRNIRAFLKACTTVFKLDDKKLFKAKELYEATNFEAVIKTLSHLSKTSIAKGAGLKPFPPDDYKKQNHQEQEEDIYGSLGEILEEREEKTDYYNYDEQEEDIYDHVEVSEKIYDDIVQCTRQAHAATKPAASDKRSHIVNEIIETEDTYVNHLKVMVEQYIKPLKAHMSSQDKETIFINTEPLYLFHMTFKRELSTRRTSTNVKLNLNAFDKYKDKFLIYATYCTGLEEAQQHTIELSKESGFRDKVEQCNKTAKRKFPLQEQLMIPFQRILKYPLLLRDLNKHTPETHEDKKAVEQAYDLMDDVARYINEYKRDAEAVKVLAQIEGSIKYEMQAQGSKGGQYGRYVKCGEIQVKFDSQEKKVIKRFAFLFQKSILLCKQRGDYYDVKEIFDMQKFKIADVPPVGKGKFSQGWSMQAHAPDGVTEHKNCTMFAKTQQEKINWVSEISKCIEAVTLSQYEGKLDKHQFELTTFEKPQCCTVCNKLLRGQVSQGYKCSNIECGAIVHKDCLVKCPRCKIAPSRPLNPKPTIHLRPRDARPRIIPNAHKSPPAQQVSQMQISDSFSKYHWFAGQLSRDQASGVLNGHPDGAFLIRESPNSPGLAISIRYGNDVKHIKIGRSGSRYYLTEAKQFESVEEVINYYKVNTLGVSFPTLPTNLTIGVSTNKQRTMTTRYAWQARNEQELSFQAGQTIVVKNSDGKWWFGECNGKEGFFPSNYVE
ncbi:proto-oncogene vav-like isoform X2 [Clytia hemisphaerica]|uniref:Uncharacterized protein n=1 Tax=Clytia hemisphaerica TaxID=252671 RepID=A0A7M5X1C4_9CNID